MPSIRPTRRACLVGAAALVAAPTWLAGCATPGMPTVITLGQTELDLLLERSFPMTRRMLELLDVTLSRPKLQLVADRNRIAVVLAVQTQERLSARQARLALSFDSALRYEARDATLRLSNVRVQSSALAGGPTPDPTRAAAASQPPGEVAPGRLARLGNALAEQALENLTLYTVPAERLATLRSLGLQPGAVTVTARGVEITLARAG